jgi:hypothetical protein
MKKAILGILVLPFISIPSFGELQLKISGGITHISGSDFNAFARGQNALFALWYTDVRGSRTEFGSAPLLQGEAVYFFSRNWGLGLGLGAFQMSPNDSLTFLSSNEPGEIQFRSMLTVIPVILNLHYRSRIAPRLALDGYAGIGVYTSRLDLFEKRLLQSGVHYFTSDFQGDFRGAFGFQGGIGIEYDLFSRFAIFFSGGLRVSSYGPISGRARINLVDPSVSQRDLRMSGDFFFFEYYSYPYIVFGQAAPGGDEGIRNIRKAEISLSGISFSAGIRMRI